MIKTTILLLLLLTTLVAKSKDSCYTVQLLSRYNSQKALDELESREYPKECTLMQIGRNLTLRCGCYERVQTAQEHLERLEQNYSNAVVVSSYRYRFEDDNKPIITPNIVEIEKVKKRQLVITQEYQTSYAQSSQEEELKLMIQVFLAKSDLESAFKVASIGYKKYPKSYYWNQKMAEISKWTNRSARSMKHMRFIYEVKYDKEIEDTLIEYGSESFQYEAIEPLVVSRAKRNPTEKNIDLLILVYRKIGSPEKVIDVLDEEYQKDKNSTMLLTKALTLSLEIGDMEVAQKYVTLIEDEPLYTQADALLLARYYYIKNDISTAYARMDTNLTVDKENRAEYVKFYQLKSDLGWYLQYNLAAAEASKHLMQLNEARLVDYERVSFVYQKSDPKLSAEAVERAYREFRLSYLFYSYANEAVNLGEFEELEALIEDLDLKNSPFVEESLFWVILAKIYEHQGERDKHREALLRALELSPQNYQIKLSLLWFFMEIGDREALEEILSDISEDSDLDTTMYLPMASAYFYLNDINRASYYTEALLYTEDKTTELLEFEFLQAYIYQAQNNEAAFMGEMKKIVAKLKKEQKENPSLLKSDIHLSNYLRAAMHTLQADKFEKKLKRAKPYLSELNYNEIAYSWALMNNAKEKSRKIFHKVNKKEIWMRFSNAILFNDHDEIENMLDLYMAFLSMGDASEMAHEDGQVALAQSVTFEGLSKSDANQNAYIKHRDISRQRSDILDIKVAHNNRDPLVQEYINSSNTNYIAQGYYLNTKLNYASNETRDKRLLVSVPKYILEAGVGVKKLFDRGYIEGSMLYHEALRSYFEYMLVASARVSTDITLKATLAKNINALESTQLLLGGKKDSAALDISWQILNSTNINFLYELDSYTSQDERYLGEGRYGRLMVGQQIRNGYPDIRISAYYDFGSYVETEGSRGVIDELQRGLNPVLPENFYNLGLSLSYGMANSAAYTRVWRPFFEVTPYYNEQTDEYNFAMNLGVGGKAWHQDHLSFGASYTQAVSGVGNSVIEFYLNYQFLYAHP